MNAYKMKLRGIFSLIFCASFTALYAQANTNDYENLMEWNRHTKYRLSPLLDVFSDSLYTPIDANNRKPIPTPDPEQTLYTIYPFFNLKGIIGTSYPLYSSRRQSKSVTLDFRYKTENCGYACVRLFSIGNGERVT